MRILVSGMGRGGTCLLTEVVRGLELVEFTVALEDRRFFKYGRLPASYGTKLTPEFSTFTLVSITRLMKRYADFYIVFSLRHPIDVFMSKIFRGQKQFKESGDGTSNVALDMIEKFHLIYKTMLTRYSNRVLAVKMEELILHPNWEVKRIAKFFKVVPTQTAFDFFKYNRNRFQQNRYKGQLDTSQVGIHKRWETVYDGFFKDKQNDILTATGCLYKIIKDWEYEVG